MSEECWLVDRPPRVRITHDGEYREVHAECLCCGEFNCAGAYRRRLLRQEEVSDEDVEQDVREFKLIMYAGHCDYSAPEGHGMTTAIDGAGLLAAIIANPADDLPRLAYADWLEENGQDERAAFIRLGVANPGVQPHNTFGPVGLREFELLAVNVRKWFVVAGLSAPGRQSAAGDHPRACYSLCWWPKGDSRGAGIVAEGRLERGFIAAIRCSLAAWLEHGKALVKAHPLERVEASDRRPTTDRDSWEVTGHRFRWAEDGRWSEHEHEPHVLPWSVFKLLDLPIRGYPTEQAALDALSAALLAWARQ